MPIARCWCHWTVPAFVGAFKWSVATSTPVMPYSTHMASSLQSNVAENFAEIVQTTSGMSLKKVLTGRVCHTLLSSTVRTPSAAFCTASQAPITPRYSLATKLAVAIPTALLGSWILFSEDPGTRVVIALQLPLRLARDIACAATIAAGGTHKPTLINLKQFIILFHQKFDCNRRNVLRI